MEFLALYDARLCNGIECSRSRTDHAQLPAPWTRVLLADARCDGVQCFFFVGTVATSAPSRSNTFTVLALKGHLYYAS